MEATLIPRQRGQWHGDALWGGAGRQEKPLCSSAPSSGALLHPWSRGAAPRSTTGGVVHVWDVWV